MALPSHKYPNIATQDRVTHLGMHYIMCASSYVLVTARVFRGLHLAQSLYNASASGRRIMLVSTWDASRHY